MERVICVQCGKYVDYEIKEIERIEIIKKKKVKYKEKIAYCKECGEPVWVEALEMENVFAPINAYCEMVGLISPQRIQEILAKYSIAKRPLAMLLGWSEVTVVRFLDGQLPSKMYSDKLIQILEDPQYFAKILEENKEKISRIAYAKAKKAVEKNLGKQNNEIKLDIETPMYQMKTMSYSNLGLRNVRKVGETWGNPICYC